MVRASVSGFTVVQTWTSTLREEEGRRSPGVLPVLGVGAVALGSEGQKQLLGIWVQVGAGEPRLCCG